MAKTQTSIDEPTGENQDKLDLKKLLNVLTAFKKGDFSARMPVEYVGIAGKIADSLNDILDLNERAADELQRISTVVGKEGRWSQRASLTGATGTWANYIGFTNDLISDLAQPTTEVARVITAVANGDLSQKMALEIEGRTLTGEFLRTAKTVNIMVDQLGIFAAEVTRVAREVGTDGKLGGQAKVEGVSGTWKDLTDSVNLMANNLTGQVRSIAEVTTAVANGDLGKKITIEAKGEILELKDTINTMVDQLGTFSAEVTRVARDVGTEGKLGGQAKVEGVSGTWKDLTENVNSMAANLTEQVRSIAEVTTAVATGDLGKKITIEAKGEILELKDTINKMVDQLGTFAAEVTRVAREVGTDGKLGGQAVVPGAGGTWKDLTDSVNSMAANLTVQVRNIAEVTTAVATGDLSRKITTEAKGEILKLKDTINIMVDQLSTFAAEVTRVAREVGTEGKLGGQAKVEGVSGTWKNLTENVNSMAANLTGQVRNIAEVTTAVANGDLSRKITTEAMGEILELKNTINKMVDQLGTFAAEVTRVAREVGTDGKLGGQAVVPGAGGTWKDLTDSVNSMAANLTVQVRNIAEVTTAVATGDLGRKITTEAKGEILELKDTINTMVDQLSTFAAEVTRVAREVGTEGKLGGQAKVEGVSGTWRDLTENVNWMAANLTGQVRNIAEVTTAVANGDLSRKITTEAMGEILELKDTINKMVDQLGTFAAEVSRVAREVGTEGKLGGQAAVPGVAGTWKDLTENVNWMAANLTGQVRSIAQVTTAVANGDLSRKITTEARGEILELRDTINKMVDQLGTFAAEVTRVAREVGTDGKLGGQAKVEGVSGTWKDLTENVNSMAANLTGQVRSIAELTTAIATGDLSKKITVDVRGEFLQLKDTANTMVDQLRSFAAEVTRVAREVGTDGKLGGQADVQGAAGTWKDLTDSVNFMAANLTGQVRNIATVTTAVANGDLTKKITVDAKGEIQELKSTINTMVDQLKAFASEVTRVAREVGTEGKLGGQAKVEGVSGVWKDLTDNVNSMAANLTAQVRGIAKVVTSVANGNLRQKLTVEARGEIMELSDTINNMIDTLATFADQVTSVAREVGVEGKLGGQASVPGAAGIWRDLTDNVNRLAANLTTQVRAIADVATAVTKGDLTRSITAEAMGELESLKNNINEMIKNLRDTTRLNTEQDWLKTNLTTLTRKLQGQKDILTVSRLILSELAPLVNMHAGIFFLNETSGSEQVQKLAASYGYKARKHLSDRFKVGEGLVGQSVFEKQRILITDVPDDYIKISSGLGEATPQNIAVMPVIFEGEVLGVLELASFSRFSDIQMTFLEQLAETIGIVLNTISATMRTEELLKQSQSLTSELQSQQEELRETNERLQKQAKVLQESEERLKDQQQELQQTNEELEERSKLLGEQKIEVENKNNTLEKTRAELQNKAEQLALTSKYKSEFLSNMSHELRTPLNSMLLLSKIMADNSDGNLTEKQIEYAKTVYMSGNDLLSLINEILDLSKIEAGKVDLELVEVPTVVIRENMERNFGPTARERGLTFDITIDPNMPPAIYTDEKRLQQVLKNLLSNAFKFTEKGGVDVHIDIARSGWDSENASLNRAGRVIAFAISDTGIGVPEDKQKIIFEAFQQADSGTARKYGGTGLGLAISREIANLLGGEVQLTRSVAGQGSTFTLYIPQRHINESQSSGSTPAAGPSTPPPMDRHARTFTPAQPEKTATPEKNGASATQQTFISDDRNSIKPGDRVLLIVEDDLAFAGILLDLARARQFKGIVAATTETGLALAKKFQPDAITLDIYLPDSDGLTMLDMLKHDPRTRHIPVHMISIAEQRNRALRLGAMNYLQKPVTQDSLDRMFAQIREFIERPVKNLLVVEDNETDRNAIVSLLAGNDIEITAVPTAEEALAWLEKKSYDCMVIDLRLPGMDGFHLIDQWQLLQRESQRHEVPIIVYTGKDLTRKEEEELSRKSEAVIIKGIRSPERLLAETTLFLHRVETNLPEEKKQVLRRTFQQDSVLSGKKVLIVDDDIRNIFALTSVLERYQMQVVYAENGKNGIKLLEETPDIDVALMDIMMPGLDGYETMRAIRRIDRFKNLPIIALTAKAMKGDREKCIEAGASDYIPKPVNADQLASVLRVWLYS